MKTLLTLIIIYSVIPIGYNMNDLKNMQDQYIQEMASQMSRAELTGTVAARKATAPFLLNLKFKAIPKDLDGQHFIEWCKSNEIKYVWWTQIEARSRPKLTQGEWWKQIKILWNKEGYGFLAEVQ